MEYRNRISRYLQDDGNDAGFSETIEDVFGFRCADDFNKKLSIKLNSFNNVINFYLYGKLAVSMEYVDGWFFYTYVKPKGIEHYKRKVHELCADAAVKQELWETVLDAEIDDSSDIMAYLDGVPTTNIFFIPSMLSKETYTKDMADKSPEGLLINEYVFSLSEALSDTLENQGEISAETECKLEELALYDVFTTFLMTKKLKL